MKLRRSMGQLSDKVEIPMTPMIDIVFQLLTFFLFSFKISSVEGDFNIRMPLASPTAATSLDTQLPVKVRLAADAEGNLASIRLDDRELPDFAALHQIIMNRVGGDAGPGAENNLEAELACDYNLKYRHVIGAVTAVSGYVTPNGRIVKLIQKIKLSPPKKPT